MPANWSIVAMVIFLALPGLAPARESASLDNRLAETLSAFRNHYGFPGATAAIVLPDGSIATATTGLADLESGLPMTSETPMLAGSIGKTFVGTIVLALESEGRLSRADLLAKHLGDRAWFGDLPNAQTITIGQLLNHTAGLPDHVHLPAFQQAWPRLAMAQSDIDPEDLVGFVLGQNPVFEAGTAWAYSDTGYVLLGLVIEAVSDQPWQEAVQARFLEPLGLTETFASDRPDLSGLAIGYVAPDNPFGMPERTADAEGRLLWNPAVESAGGGFAATSADLARWGHLLFGGAAMTQPYLDRLLGAVPVDPDALGVFYGAGVAIYTNTPRGLVWGHGGWIPGYVSSLRHYADHGVTVAFQINTDVGIVDDTTDLVPILEATLTDLAISMTMSRMHLAPETGDGIVILSNSQRAWPLWAASQDYLFLFSILPRLWPWLVLTETARFVETVRAFGAELAGGRVR